MGLTSGYVCEGAFREGRLRPTIDGSTPQAKSWTEQKGAKGEKPLNIPLCFVVASASHTAARGSYRHGATHHRDSSTITVPHKLSQNKSFLRSFLAHSLLQ